MLRKQVKKWSEITGVSRTALKPNPKYAREGLTSDMPPCDMLNWRLRKCDREDSADWMPIHLRESGAGLLYSVCVYYINVNPDNPDYPRIITITVMGRRIMMRQWEGKVLVGEQSAVIEHGVGELDRSMSDVDVLLKHFEDMQN